MSICPLLELHVVSRLLGRNRMQLHINLILNSPAGILHNYAIPVVVVDTNQLLICNFLRFKGWVQVFLDVQVRRTVAVGTNQDSCSIFTEKLFNGFAKSECFASSIRANDQYGRKVECGRSCDGPYCLLLLGIQSGIQLMCWPVGSRAPGDIWNTEISNKLASL